VRDRGARLVALQLPEGLKRRALELVDGIEKATDARVVVSADPCYGACDLIDAQLEPLGVDLVVHVGHTAMGDTPPSLPTLFVEARSTIPVDVAVAAAMGLLRGGDRVGLLATTQYREGMARAGELLSRGGHEVVVGEGGRRLAFPGQVLGCDLSAARAVSDRVDAFVLLGGGAFHGAGVSMATGRPVVVADVEAGGARSVEDERDRLLRRRGAVIARAGDAETFGILVESRPGQQRWGLALALRDDLRAAGRRPVVLLLREVTPDRLLALGMDAYVSTACPRIAVDDQSSYATPVLTPLEVRILIGKADWSSYRLDDMS
jgi:2-(3-amino-3-carboxypropyl)histidine synthase